MTDIFPGAGGRIEYLRRTYRDPEGRRLSQEELATRAGLSRQTYSVAVNSDRLTGRTARKLAEVLGVSEDQILFGESPAGQWEPPADDAPGQSAQGAEFEDWVSNLDRIVVTLRNYPGGELGQRLKIGFLNAVEDIARETGNSLPVEYYMLRKRVQDGEQI